VLKIFSERMKTRMRSFDLFARTGGEEFVVALVDVQQEKAYFIAERLRRCICETPIPVSTEEGHINVSVSIGGVYLGTDALTIEDALKRADDQLYAAKENGRNAVFFEGVGRLDPDQYREKTRGKE
jgi:diguanylate cyclase (GGDEF)-like protein